MDNVLDIPSWFDVVMLFNPKYYSWLLCGCPVYTVQNSVCIPMWTEPKTLPMVPSRLLIDCVSNKTPIFFNRVITLRDIDRSLFPTQTHTHSHADGYSRRWSVSPLGRSIHDYYYYHHRGPISRTIWLGVSVSNNSLFIHSFVLSLSISNSELNTWNQVIPISITLLFSHVFCPTTAS